MSAILELPEGDPTEAEIQYTVTTLARLLNDLPPQITYQIVEKLDDERQKLARIALNRTAW